MSWIDLAGRERHRAVMVTRDGIIAVYMMASGKHGTLYIGVTSDLSRRVWEHRESLLDGFTKTYGCTRLVWWETHDLIVEAIAREKRLKAWRRDWKIELIEADNPHWDDLYGRW